MLRQTPMSSLGTAGLQGSSLSDTLWVAQELNGNIQEVHKELK